MIKNPYRFLTSKQAQDLDLKSKEKFGISTLVLMENAGCAIAREATKILRARPKKICIFCGKGNNGGDGFVAARHLLAYGIRPEIFLAGEAGEVKNEARENLEILLKLKQKIIEVNEKKLYLVKNTISKCVLIIDALLGVGLKGEVRGIYRDLIAIINASEKCILSVDIPSGLDATWGKVLGCCVKANRTVTFAALKRGMVSGDGPKYCGKVVVAALGVPL